MGIKEQGLLRYLKDCARYADLMNGTIFQGEQVVSPGYLRAVSRKKSVLLAAAWKDASQRINSSHGEIRYLERERDMIMLHDKEKCRFFLACEGQSSSDYTMPVRLFTYDGVEYSAQAGEPGEKHVQGSRPGHPLTPVFHQVLYLGEKRWLSKHSLQEMMEIPEEMEKFRHLLPDYHLNFVDTHEQNPELFRTEWRDIFGLMKHSRKKEELKKYIEEHMDKLQKLTRETRFFLAILLDQYEILEHGEAEVKDVCEAWDGAMLMYKEEALKDGLKQGMHNGLKRTALNMYRRGYSPEETAGIVEEPVQTVREWYKEFAG